MLADQDHQEEGSDRERGVCKFQRDAMTQNEIHQQRLTPTPPTVVCFNNLSQTYLETRSLAWQLGSLGD